MPTEAHKEKWREFEGILNFRANVCLAMLFCINLYRLFAGKWHTTTSRQFLQSDNTGNIDCELALSALPYVNITMIILNVLRLVCIIVSYWKPGIAKYYFLLQALFWAAREMAPIDYG